MAHNPGGCLFHCLEALRPKILVTMYLHWQSFCWQRCLNSIYLLTWNWWEEVETGKEILGMKDLNSCLCPRFYLGQKSAMLEVLGSLVSDLFYLYLSSSSTQLPGHCLWGCNRNSSSGSWDGEAHESLLHGLINCTDQINNLSWPPSHQKHHSILHGALSGNPFSCCLLIFKFLPIRLE